MITKKFKKSENIFKYIIFFKRYGLKYQYKIIFKDYIVEHHLKKEIIICDSTIQPSHINTYNSTEILTEP